MHYFFYILLILIVHLTSGIPHLLAQSYLHEPTIWKEYIRGAFNYPISEDDYTIELKGDTLIEGRVYFKTLKTGITTFTYPNGQKVKVPINEYTYPIREEDKKFYIYNMDSQQETLLHDFDLSIGDTIIAEISCVHKIVVWIDTVYLGNIPRKRFHLKDNHNSVYVIEGVGSTRGLFSNACSDWYGPFYLECFIQDQSYLELYSERPGVDCSGLVATEINKNEDFNIYPNPFTDQLSIQFRASSLEPVSVLVTNLLGTIVYQTHIDFPESLERIDLGQLPTGLYIVWLITKNAESSFKVIKQ